MIADDEDLPRAELRCMLATVWLDYALKPIAADREPFEAAVYSGRPQAAHTERTRPGFIAGPWGGLMKTRSSSLVIGFLVVFGTSQVWAQAAPAVAAGSYECWGNGSARPLMNLKVSGKSSYSDSEGKERGSFVHDPVTGSITFKGGHLDGVMPSGFTSVYHETHKKPTISFRSGRGAEASFCERVGK